MRSNISELKPAIPVLPPRTKGLDLELIGLCLLLLVVIGGHRIPTLNEHGTSRVLLPHLTMKHS